MRAREVWGSTMPRQHLHKLRCTECGLSVGLYTDESGRYVAACGCFRERFKDAESFRPPSHWD